MIETLITLGSAILIAVILIKWVNHQLKAKASEKYYTVYRIQFKNANDKVDLRQSEMILNHVTIAVEDANGYVVHSDINDKDLKELIASEFEVRPSQFIVTSKQFMNF